MYHPSPNLLFVVFPFLRKLSLVLSIKLIIEKLLFSISNFLPDLEILFTFHFQLTANLLGEHSPLLKSLPSFPEATWLVKTTVGKVAEAEV